MVWVPMMTASMMAAAVVALQPDSLADLWLVRDWLRHWLEGGNPYRHFYGGVDYPPAAFLVLWPLGLPSDQVITFAFIPLAILTMAAAGLVLVRWLSERLNTTLPWQAQAALVAMMLSGGASRGGVWRGQTAALAMLLGALALFWCRRRPLAAAVALALCSYKPHLALGFGLVILLSEWRPWVVVMAAALVVGLSAGFAASIDQSLPQVLQLYAENLLALYDGPDRVRGLLSIRWVFEDLLADYSRGTVVYVAMALASLVLIALSAHRRRDVAGRTIVAAACLLWSLLFLPQQLYHGVLAWPAVWLLMWPEAGIIRTQAIRLTVVAAMVLFTVADIPRLALVLIDPAHSLAQAPYYWRPLRLVALLALMIYGLNSVRSPTHGTTAMTRLPLPPPVAQAARRVLTPLRAWHDRRARRRRLKALPQRLSNSADYEEYLMHQLARSLGMRTYIAHGRVQQLVDAFRRADRQPADGRSVLCVGCRNAHELTVFREAGFDDVVGIDLFSESRDIQVMDMHAMTFPDARFDVIFACHSLEHALDVGAVLAEFSRVARPGAVCVLEVPVRFRKWPGREDLQDFDSADGLIAQCAPILQEVLFVEQAGPVARLVFRIRERATTAPLR